ncbi:2972_t:CDS:2 [Paraglomus brasilianum]|uniref:3-methyl-2-oxobutanoate hydroxymethyltransferase n=1 Tax=Paraglomus brasilianum TaxID=144538 RepID=A0A9N9G8I2_9GLOM|nr:2972_t:CDS:2 [Paraglomus brasilianum]
MTSKAGKISILCLSRNVLHSGRFALFTRVPDNRVHTFGERSYSSRPAESPHPARQKVTINIIRKLYSDNEPITVLTAHDYPSASFVDKAGIDICLVGDSLAMVALGHESTSPEMLHHCRAVARGAKSPFMVADMPFGSYEVSINEAVKNAIRFIKDGKMEAVKLEGGTEMAETIRAITRIGIPVLGHVGLTPQRQSSLGGYRVQGKTLEKAKKLIEDAKAIQEAGCFGMVLETIPEPVATHITKLLKIPTIGIGAGPGTSGQVLVQLDMLGIFDRFAPRFAKTYANVNSVITDAIRTYHKEVKERKFPAKEHCYPMEDGELERFLNIVGSSDNE